MPRIVLKHKSPEYADANKKVELRHCDMPGCVHHGEHKAPKHRGLNDFYWFCFDHVKEYNSAWDFFHGMSNNEVEEHIYKSMYGDRPTWQYATHKEAYDALHEAAEKTYSFNENEKTRHNRQNTMDRNSPEFEALAIMGLAPPVTLDDIKARYKVLAKKYHPDLNKGCKKSESLLKEINMSYTLLKLAFEEYKRLPDHKF